jgi:hypothetical protein
MTTKLTATSMRREEAESLLMLEWSERWHSVQVKKDGEKGRIVIEGSTRVRGGWQSWWWCLMRGLVPIF